MLRFNVGTKNKAMYGAGRNMQDFLESEQGLPLVIRVSLRSRFNVIWGIFEPKYHHEAQCLVLLNDNYDKKHRTQVYNSTCIINSQQFGLCVKTYFLQSIYATLYVCVIQQHMQGKALRCPLVMCYVIVIFVVIGYLITIQCVKC